MENYNEIVKKQREFFLEGKTKSLAYRMQALRLLREIIKLNEKSLMDALKEDLNKNPFESYMSEIGMLLGEISFTLKHLKKWSEPRRVKATMAQFGSKSVIYPEPYGVTLIISPWNYPFQLAFAPLIGAIAAGNCSIIKPSELTPITAKLIGDLISQSFPEEYITVIQGGVETSQALLKEKFDYIFFTGSVAVGKVIMEAAAKTLTPVTLELGGKSPCIVHKDANLPLAAKRIAWGKFINAGQTCVAPDYIYAHSEVKEEFLQYLIQSIKALYSEDVLLKGEFTRIVSKKHFERLTGFLSEDKIHYGGRYESSSLMIEPTILDNVTWDDFVMKDEIFGPILPVLSYEDTSNMINTITERPKPLALYIFSENKAFQNRVLDGISFGGGCINDTIFHLSSPYLPFGGVGESGVGAYHGKGSFDTFTHEKSILKQTTRFDLPLRYPNRKNALETLKRLLK
ncbi:aldehyde dehydrogenase [Niallia endozanthoxylica]|uniref:Aldehyde dehydrogenase n=1 Tax=Niallia endozanthoxylica TaxID=2036016 RepID=A0A5J5HNH8_9BACI|nr:aldehyde dehydrogenase [Niallia endozanthoxylica]KAA9021792.1 aldehyde dehydrogenase [Niallia endozanthoxylica]